MNRRQLGERPRGCEGDFMLRPAEAVDFACEIDDIKREINERKLKIRKMALNRNPTGFSYAHC